MLEILYSPIALDDMQYIYNYVFTNWGEVVAKRVLAKLTSDIRRLGQHPILGADLGKIIDIPTEYRYIFSERNYVFYRVDYDKIRIIRVLNERQNYIKTLFGVSINAEDG